MEKLCRAESSSHNTPDQRSSTALRIQKVSSLASSCSTNCEKVETHSRLNVDSRCDLTKPNTQESTDGGDYEEEDEGEIFARNLNCIILQYLESCGLVDTYCTFWDECRSSGMLIPSHFSAEIERGISLQDVETLLMHFDQENGEALLELWEVLISEVDTSQNQKEVEKIIFYIQVYIALIPFRQKMSEARKNASMKKLRDYFETKSEACTIDNEMSSLFALPFVPDPETHPVFRDLFKVSWVKKLRSRIKDLARALCSPNKLITRDKTDLAKMFKACSRAIAHEIETTDGKKMCILSNSEPVEFTSGAVTARASSSSSSNASLAQQRDEFSPTQFFQRMNDLILENERYKKEESKYEKQCAQLLNVSIILANSLEDAAQGKEVNMEKLRNEVNDCLPLSMQKKSTEVNAVRARVPSANSYDSDASNANQGRTTRSDAGLARRKQRKHDPDELPDSS